MTRHTGPLPALPIERAGSRRPVTWLTIVGAVLLPVVIGGLLVAALYNPVERLDAVPAAIVNEDAPVTVDGQTVPLGRQLAAGLVEGSDEMPSNLDWTITNADDAARGLADGAYTAVVTIPENFSAAATSPAPGRGTPERAVITVTTPPDSKVVDDAISAQVAQTAAALTGTQLSEAYLENVFLGFTTLGDQLGQAADGAAQLAGGARAAADGAGELSGGVSQLATGAGGLAGGAAQLAGGVSQVAGGASGLAGGASQLSGGAAQLSGGAAQAADGLDEWAASARQLAANGQSIAGGMQQIAGQIPTDVPPVPQELVDAANAVSAHSTQINAKLTGAAAKLQHLSAECATSGLSPELCAALAEASADVQANLPTVTVLVSDAGQIAQGMQTLSQQLPQLGSGLQSLSSALNQLSGGIDQLADGATSAAGGVRELSAGAGELSTGASTLSSGASQLAAGATGAAAGARELSAGGTQLADGAGAAAAGAGELAAGVSELAGGSAGLADGLHQATDALPSYTEAEAARLASVVADPVGAEGVGSNIFGASAIPLLTMVALWFGGLGTFLALRAVTARALASRRPSALLALRGLAPGALIGAVQGLLVAGVVQLAGSYDWAEWSLYAAVSVTAGVAFAAVHQALVATLGGVGRWVAALVGVLALATGIVSTVPAALTAVAGLLPTAPAYHGMLAALTSTDGLGAAMAGLAVWALLSFAVTTLAVARRRSVSTRQLLAPPPRPIPIPIPIPAKGSFPSRKGRFPRELTHHLGREPTTSGENQPPR